MFTGIVTDIGEISDVQDLAGDLRRFFIACSYDRNTIALGASIACSGVCLTVVETGLAAGRTWFAVEAAAETIRLTTVRSWQKDTKLNLERSLKMGDELGGHLVSGHVDGLATVLDRTDLTDQARFLLAAPKELSRFIAKKGSVALDGVSLTVNEADGSQFSVLVIPHTLQVTTIGGWRKDTQINLEIDVMARYAARLMEAR
ncbi:riboflavin synthase [Pseudorhodoplanes sinuspersici]|uniref:Riboflavin synthase n=1 Tax=Pseudorhodoplanes sinuspersici TaxID=1235591 RepID=A0A1W6ZXS2_9HYPH|nr:riboflavin synthase [Pseudorhodoplanes sinuspersici]ARQ01555.1 riboflavin synthase [Pseudorhodoplanes sinuspersici]RKE73260.1 riboflavin synthase alpha chain [Pseudorhodoplanes sinuspersici]